MVKNFQQEDKNYFQCEECGYIYETQDLAQKCEDWCREHKSCNLEIIRYGQRPKEESPKIVNKSNFISILLIILIGISAVFAFANLKVGSNKPIFNQGSINEGLVQQVVAQVLPKEGFKTNLIFADSVKKMIDCGLIDLEKMKKLYNGQIPEYLQKTINGSKEPIIIDRETASYLLNLFWPLGLSNKTEFNKNIPFTEKELSYLASTAGWWLGKENNGAAYFNKCEIIKLTPEQEAIVYEVAKNTFRPCCDNSTFAQDCNHGSALLGALELAASQGYSKDELYKLALQLNSFWFPDSYVKIALLKKVTENVDWPLTNARINTGETQMNTDNFNLRKSALNPRQSALIKEIMSAKYSSISGYIQNVEQKLAKLNPPGIQTQGGSCGL